jgi:2-polyprenyl-3-methyl-5-hydroxy-6-metoxy-1,4-benzoquinol methylase
MNKGVTSKKYWDKYWGEGKPKFPNYNRSRGIWYSLDMLLSEHIQKTRQRLGKSKLKIMDCGCGEGLFLKFLYEGFDDIELWGIDYSDAIEKARFMAEELHYSFNLRLCDLRDRWDEDLVEEFDIVISLGLIEHFQDPQEILSQLAIPLVKGGSLISIIPNFNGAYNFLWKLYDKENYSYHVPIRNEALLEIHKNIELNDVEFYALGVPSIPGPHNIRNFSLRALKFLTASLNRYILRKLYPRQSALSKTYPLTPTVACVGYK